MKIAVASDGKVVSGHFGHCEGFMLYTTEQNEIKEKVFVPNPGHRPGFLPVFLKEQDANIIIAGGMGGTAQDLFAENGIEVVVGAQGAVDAAVLNLLAGELKSTNSICSEHAHAGECGE